MWHDYLNEIQILQSFNANWHNIVILAIVNAYLLWHFCLGRTVDLQLVVKGDQLENPILIVKLFNS